MKIHEKYLEALKDHKAVLGSKEVHRGIDFNWKQTQIQSRFESKIG